MASPPPLDLSSTCTMSNMHGNDAFATGKQGSALDTAFEVMADSQRDRYFSTVGFGIVSTMHHPAALMPQKLAEMKDPRPIIVMERADTEYRYTVNPPATTQNRPATTQNRPAPVN